MLNTLIRFTLFSYCLTLTLIVTSQILIPYRDDAAKLWGYKNESGEVVVKPAFSEARNFEGGVAQVAITKKERYWGLINEAGEYILKPTYNGMEPFCRGYAAVRYGDPGFDNNIRFGFIDMKGNEVVRPRFYHAEKCISEDKWFKVQYRGGNWIYVNLQDKESKTPVISEYQGLPNKDFYLSLSVTENAVLVTDRVTKKETKVQLPDKGEMTGKTIRLNNYVTAIPCMGTANASSITHYYLLIPDKSGATFLKPTNGNSFYSYIKYDSRVESYFTAGSDLYNHKGELIGTNALLDFKSTFFHLTYKPLNGSEQIAKYYNLEGVPLNMPVVKDLMVFQDGDYISFIHDGKVQMLNFRTNSIDKQFVTYDDSFFKSMIQRFGYQKVYDAMGQSNALPVRTENSEWTIVGLSGGTYNFKVKADYILPFFNLKYAPVNYNGKWGLINKKGVQIVPCEFDSLDFTTYRLLKNNQLYYVDASDNLLPYTPPTATSVKPTATSVSADKQGTTNDPERVVSFCVEAIYYTPPGTRDVERVVIVAIVTTRQKKLGSPELMKMVQQRIIEEVQSNFGPYFYTKGKNEFIEPTVSIYENTDRCMSMRESIKNGYEKGKTIFLTY